MTEETTAFANARIFDGVILPPSLLSSHVQE
jgi:hypothetical protein